MNGDFPRLAQVVCESALWRFVESSARSLQPWWQHSTVGAFTGSMARWWGSCDRAVRMRHVSSVIAWAAVFYAAVLPSIPKYVASGLPRLAVATFAVTSALVAWRSPDLAQAWPDSWIKALLVRLARE